MKKSTRPGTGRLFQFTINTTMRTVIVIVPISDKIRIASNTHCWQLEHRRNCRERPRFEPYKYYSSLRQALEAACEQEVRADPAQSLAEAASAISRITSRYEKLFDCALAEVSAKSPLRAVS
jgi:hypothetical protein